MLLAATGAGGRNHLPHLACRPLDHQRRSEADRVAATTNSVGDKCAAAETAAPMIEILNRSAYGNSIETPRDYIAAVIELEKERIKRLSEVPEMTAYFFTPTVEYSLDTLVSQKQKLTPAAVEGALTAALDALAAVQVSDEAATEERLTALVAELGLKNRGQLFMVLRAALTGRTVSPPLFGTMRVLGQEARVARLGAARTWLRERADNDAGMD